MLKIKTSLVLLVLGLVAGLCPVGETSSALAADDGPTPSQVNACIADATNAYLSAVASCSAYDRDAESKELCLRRAYLLLVRDKGRCEATGSRFVLELGDIKFERF